jgi:hypothetical protein
MDPYRSYEPSQEAPPSYQASLISRLRSWWLSLRYLHNYLPSFSIKDATDKEARALAESPWLEPVELLTLVSPKLSADAWRYLLSSPYLKSVRRLLICGHSYNERIDLQGAVLAISASPQLSTLTELRLEGSFGVEGARSLALSHLRGLVQLTIKRAELGDEGARLIAGSPIANNLQALELHDCSIRDDGARALCALSSLRLLNLFDNHIGDLGAQALAQANLPQLEQLSLNKNLIHESGAKAFAETSASQRLKLLSLGDNQLGRAGLESLARCPFLTGGGRYQIYSGIAPAEKQRRQAIAQEKARLEQLRTRLFRFNKLF